MTTQPPTRESGVQTHKSRTSQLIAGLTKRGNLRPTAGAIISSVQQANEEPPSSRSSDRSSRPLPQIIKAYIKKALSKPKRLYNKLLATSTDVDGAGDPTGSETRVLPSDVPSVPPPLNSSDTDASFVFERVERPADVPSNRSSHSTYDEPNPTSPKDDPGPSSTNFVPLTKTVSENEAATGSKHRRTGSLRTQLVIDERHLSLPPISTRSTSPDLPDPSDQQLGKDNDQTAPLDIHVVIIHPGYMPSGKRVNIKRQPCIVHLDTGCKVDAVSGDFADQFKLERNTDQSPTEFELADGKYIMVDQWVWLALEADVDTEPEWMKFWVVEGASSWRILFGENTIRNKNLLEKARRDPRPKNFWILTARDGKDLSPVERKRDKEHDKAAHKLAAQNDTHLQQADSELLYEPFTSTADNGSGKANSNDESNSSQRAAEAGPDSTDNNASKG